MPTLDSRWRECMAAIDTAAGVFVHCVTHPTEKGDSNSIGNKLVIRDQCLILTLIESVKFYYETDQYSTYYQDFLDLTDTALTITASNDTLRK